MKKFLDFIRLEAVSPSRVKKKWKKINFSMPRGALGVTSFYLHDGLRRKGGTTHSKKFLAIIWPYFVSPTQRKEKIQILRQPRGHPLFFWFEIKLALQTRSLLKPKCMICTLQFSFPCWTIKQTKNKKQKQKTLKQNWTKRGLLIS